MTEARESNLLRSVYETTWKFYVWVVFLAAVLAGGLVAYIHQLRNGLIVTGLRDQVSWGLYITNFVFFIGISHVGALLSAILRFSGAEWRRPLTRMAEAITTASLFIGGMMPVIDMGRPDRIFNLLRYGRIQSPILWDIISVTTYFTGSTLFLWTLMIPDIALLRDNFPSPSRWRRKLYEVLALGYRGSAEQHRLLEKAISAVTLVILPLAISVHTVVSWIFAMTLRPGWHSSIFGPYFVVGALYSGAASVILAMYVFRRVYRLEGYLEPVHFRNLGLLLMALTMLYLYFNINEYLTFGYKFPGAEKEVLERLFYGDYASLFWGVQTLGVFLPMLLLMTVLGLRKYEAFLVPGVATASALVVVCAWLKRYLIIVPAMQSPYLPAQHLPEEWMFYRPTWVEWAITAAAIAGFLLLYSLLGKLFPIVSIWETRAVVAEAHEERPEARWWRPLPARLAVAVLAVVLITALTTKANAAPHAKAPKATVLEVAYAKLPASTGSAAHAEGSTPKPESEEKLAAESEGGSL